MKRLLVVMYVLCLSFSGIAYAEEGQNVQNAQPQPVVQAQQAPVQGAPEQDGEFFRVPKIISEE